MAERGPFNSPEAKVPRTLPCPPSSAKRRKTNQEDPPIEGPVASSTAAGSASLPTVLSSQPKASPPWCAVHIVSRTNPVYRVAVDRAQTFDSCFAEYKTLYFGEGQEAAFFAFDVELFPTSVVGECPRVNDRVVLVQAIPPQEAMCVRLAAQISHVSSFWDHAATEGVLSKQAFVQAVHALQIQDCDPEAVWNLSMGEAASADRAKFAEHFSTYECITETKLFATREQDSSILCNIIVGASVTLLAPPELAGRRLLGHVQTGEHQGFVTLARDGTLLFQRSFAFQEPFPADLTFEGSEQEVQEEDKKIDDAVGVIEKDEEQEELIEKAKGRRGRPRIAKSRVAQIEKDIQKLQNTTDFLIPRASFGRAVKECLDTVQKVPDDEDATGEEPKAYRISSQALKVLQDCAEQHVTSEFSKLRLLASHRKRVTIDVRDQKMLQLLRD